MPLIDKVHYMCRQTAWMGVATDFQQHLNKQQPYTLKYVRFWANLQSHENAVSTAEVETLVNV